MTHTRFQNFFKNSSTILFIAVAAGLLFPSNALEFLIVPALLLMMTFSLNQIEFSIPSRPLRSIAGLIINYVFLSGFILWASSYLPSTNLRLGFVVMAAVPPAVAIIPLTRILKGDVLLSLYTETLCYLSALFLMPAIILVFGNSSWSGALEIIELIVLLILLPMVLSRATGKIGIDPFVPINLGLFIVTYVVIGMNRDALFLSDTHPVVLIAFARTYLTAFVVYLIASFRGVRFEEMVSYTLFGGFKNLGLCAAVSLLLFGPTAAIPAAICTVVESLLFITVCFLNDRVNLTSSHRL